MQVLPAAQAGYPRLGPGRSEFGTPGYDQAEKGGDDRLRNTEGLVPEVERYTRIYRGRHELIDHIMISHALTESVEEVTTGGEMCRRSVTLRVRVTARKHQTINR